jgi:hypothetical protein
MALNVHIPKEGFFTLYARGKIERKISVDDLGTFIRFEGVVILFYTYPHHRRAYIVRNSEELGVFPVMKLPNVKHPVGIIYRALGRRIDILRNVYWNLEQLNGSGVYSWNTLFWQKVSCLIDGTEKGETKAIKSNLILLSRGYERNR